MRYTSTHRAPGLTATEFRALASFRFALRRFFAFSENIAVSVGLTPQQYQALLAIRAHEGPEGMTIGELAAQLLIRHHSAVGLVDRLESRGLVKRAAAPDDGRQVCVTLSRDGTGALNSLAETHRAELLRMRPEVIALLESLG